MVAHRHEPHLGAQPPVVAEQPVQVENAEELRERRLRVSHRDVELALHAVGRDEREGVDELVGAQLSLDDASIRQHRLIIARRAPIPPHAHRLTSTSVASAAWCRVGPVAATHLRERVCQPAPLSFPSLEFTL